MGSMKRKLQRTKEQRQYEQLAAAWRLERYRRDTAERNGTLDPKLPPLGPRPSFRQFRARLAEIEAARELEAAKAEADRLEAEKKLDLDWKEE